MLHDDSYLINRTRELSRDLGEQTIAHLLGGKKRISNKGADLRLDKDTNIEVKSRLYGQPVNILVKQLLELTEDDIYALLFYKTISGLRPLGILRQANPDDDLYEHFKNSIYISKIFLFPSKYIKSFYETTHMKEVTISSSGLRHKGLAVKTATKIYDSADEIKSIIETPIDSPSSKETLTYAVGEKVNLILRKKGYIQKK